MSETIKTGYYWIKFKEYKESIIGYYDAKEKRYPWQIVGSDEIYENEDMKVLKEVK